LTLELSNEKEADMLTISAIKADVGSIGGHTRPSRRMIEAARNNLEQAMNSGMLTGFNVTHTGDDICLLMKIGHKQSTDPDFAWVYFWQPPDR
jgi:fructose 1,6-bisphosphate aldolase/phosphatase